MIKQVRLEMGWNPSDVHIWIDDLDISSIVTHMSLSLGVDQPPIMVLEILPASITIPEEFEAVLEVRRDD